MRAYIMRRLLLMIPTVLIITIAIFLLVRLIPGSAVDLMVEDLHYANNVEALKQQLGLDKPAPIQYFTWLGNAVRGDLGNSLWTKTPVIESIRHRLPVTIELAVLTLVFGSIWGVTIGIISAIRQDTIIDYFSRSTAITFLSLPTFWIATLIVILPALWWGKTVRLAFVPFFDDPLGNLATFIIPAAIVGSHTGASIMRMTRTMMLEVLRQDYIRTAWAKGLRSRVVVSRHALKNALIPVLTIMGLQLANAMSGSVIMENVFSLPGMGQLLVDAQLKRDYVLIQGLILMFGIWIAFVNLVVDITYAWIDPRIQLR